MKSISKIMLASAVFIMGALSEERGISSSETQTLFGNCVEVKNNEQAKPNPMQRRLAMSLLPEIPGMQRRLAMSQLPVLDNKEVMLVEMNSGPIISPLSNPTLQQEFSEALSADAVQIAPSNPTSPLFRVWTWSRGSVAPKSKTILGNGLLPKTRFNNWAPSSNKSSGLPEADKPINHPLIHFLERVLSMRPAYYPSVQKI